jgi:MFS family permease
MQTVVWLTAWILVCLLGLWITGSAVRRWPRQRVVLAVALVTALMVEILVLDLEPPREMSTVRASGEVLSFPIATVFWMLHGLLFGGVIASITTRALDESPRAKAHSD